MESTRSHTLTVCRASAGTGKTYTLAATYVALLLSGESYRSILAVTFTNKATQEMKDRILLFLDNIARNTGKDADNALKAVRSHMIRNTSLSDDKLREIAGKLYRDILEDYDNMHISTIDTFLMQLLSGLGQMLDNATAGAQVQLDVEEVISQAIDNLLSKPLDTSDKALKRLSNYVADKLDDGQSWDVRTALHDVAKELYNESVQQLDADKQIVFDADKIIRYRNALDYRVSESYKQLCDLYDQWKNWTPEVSGVSKLKDFITEIGQYLDGTCKEDNMFRGGSDGVINILKGTDKTGSFDKNYAKMPARGEVVRAAMLELYRLCLECKRYYNTQKTTTKLLGDLALMADIRREIRNVLAEQNMILLAQTADVLHRAMRQGDADFILEKVGIRYNHIMLDEFQDTSVLQWENFKPLLQEILSNGGTVFIVGDIKQSIYRWRNGDWTIMKNLGTETPYLGNFFQDKSLSRNFRSQKQIVQFNLNLFHRLTSEGYIVDLDPSLYDEGFPNTDIAAYYAPSHSAGYVQLQLVQYGDKTCELEKKGDAEQHILTQVFETIAQRLQQGDKPSDMLLLVRTHDEAQTVVDFYRNYAPTSAPLANVAIVSGDSFHLDTSTSVLMIIHSLQWLVKRNEVSRAYLKMVCPNLSVEQLETINLQTPLCELLEEIIKILPAFQPQDLAYVNCLLDCAHDFVTTHDPSAEAFLDYWDDKLHQLSIAAPEMEAIRIMTIHSAKGLEAPNVFIPFCNWKIENDKGTIWCQARGLLKEQVEPLQMIPIRLSSRLSESDYQSEYEEEHKNQHIDALNALYVALTRARNALYIYGMYKSSDLKNNGSVAALLHHLYDDQLSEGTTALESEQSSSGKMQDRFSFTDASTKTAELHVGERPISFQLSRESMDCLKYGIQEGEETFSQIDLGNVCHGIMEDMETRADEDAAIIEAQMNGLIPDEKTLEQIQLLIDGAWEHEQLRDWFSGQWELLREVTFLTANREMRPDRVMINRADSKAIVLDYKFGLHHDAKYIFQVRDYMRIMLQLGYKHVEGYLWFAQDNKLQPVTLK